MDSGLYENNTGPLDSIVFESLTVLVCSWDCLNKNASYKLRKRNTIRMYGLGGGSVSVVAGFETSEVQAKSSIMLSSCCLQIQIQNSQLLPQHCICLHNVILLTTMIMD